MNFSYVAYTKNRKLVKGKMPADNPEAARELLKNSGYQILSLKKLTPFFSMGKSSLFAGKVKTSEVILFSRQLALLLESGVDIVTAFELLQEQSSNKVFKRVLAAVADTIRGGSSLSEALSKHPKVFSQIYYRAISAGEQGGNLEMVLRNMSDYMDRVEKTQKKIKSALTYPAIVAVVAVVVVAILIYFVLPTFTDLFASFGSDLPPITQLLINITDWLTAYGIFLFMVLGAALVAGLLYIRTTAGKYWWSGVILRMPVIGRIIQLSELSRVCQTISLLFRAGLPLPEILTQAMNAAGNGIVAEALEGVHHDLIRGEGLSGPMRKRSVFLSLMVQMVSVGEETGKIDETLSTVVTTYEIEADDRIASAIALLQPTMLIVIGIVVAFIASALVSSMYGMYEAFE